MEIPVSPFLHFRKNFFILVLIIGEVCRKSDIILVISFEMVGNLSNCQSGNFCLHTIDGLKGLFDKR